MATVDVAFHRCFISLGTRPREAGAGHVQGRGQGERAGPAGPAGPGMAAAAAAGTLDPGRLSLYFCGSIRGGREDRELYVRIVSRLRRFGVVLTEHVAAAEVDESGEGGGACGAGGRVQAGPSAREELRWGAQTACIRPGTLRPGFSYYLDLWVFRGELFGLLPAFIGAGWEEAALASSLPPSTELSFDIGGISPP